MNGAYFFIYTFAIIFSWQLFSCNALETKQPSVSEVIAGMDLEKRKPKPGEWVAEHQESHQSFEAYKAADPNRVDAQHSKLYCTIIGEMDSASRSIYSLTKNYLSIIYGVTIDTISSIPKAMIPKYFQRMNKYGMQLQSLYILDSILIPKVPNDAFGLIAFTSHDLFPEFSWNYVFGQAKLKQRVGLWSMARYGTPDNEAAYNECAKRTIAVATHEVGHMFGITHCTAYECVMNGSNDLYESDSQPMWMCHECFDKIIWNTKRKPTQCIIDLHTFWKANRDVDSLAYTYYGMVDSLSAVE
jgi:archaemetzincin